LYTDHPQQVLHERMYSNTGMSVVMGSGACPLQCQTTSSWTWRFLSLREKGIGYELEVGDTRDSDTRGSRCVLLKTRLWRVRWQQDSRDAHEPQEDKDKEFGAYTAGANARRLYGGSWATTCQNHSTLPQVAQRIPSQGGTCAKDQDRLTAPGCCQGQLDLRGV
jgi:hypothetical protein